MSVRPSDLPASQQWLLIAEYLFGLVIALRVAIYFYIFFDRWVVSHRGIEGMATVEEYELVRSLPGRIWSVRLTIVPEDIPNTSMRYNVMWSDSDYLRQLEELSVGARLRVRFRRSPRRLAMPAR
jgi:hypothetical protein